MNSLERGPLPAYSRGFRPGRRAAHENGRPGDVEFMGLRPSKREMIKRSCITDPLNYNQVGNQLSAASSRYFNTAARAGQYANQAASYRSSLQDQMRKMPCRSYGDWDIKYELDLFALRTGEVWQGYPVYDLGAMVP